MCFSVFYVLLGKDIFMKTPLGNPAYTTGKIFHHYLKQYSLAQLNKNSRSGFNNNNIMWNIRALPMVNSPTVAVQGDWKRNANPEQNGVKLFAKGTKARAFAMHSRRGKSD